MLFQCKSADKLYIMLEIQSTVIRGSLVLRDGDEFPHILFTEKIDMPVHRGITSTQLVKNVISNVTKVCENVLKHHSLSLSARSIPDLGRRIDEVHFILSAPWSVSQARIMTVEFDKPTILTRSRLEKILQEERRKLQSESRNSTTLIEEKIFDVRLNGYPIEKWEGKIARSAMISYSISISGSDAISRLNDVVAHIVGKKGVHFHSSLLLQYVALKNDIVLNNDNYILIHVHGEITDIVVVSEGHCTFFGTMPIGIYGIVRKFAKGRNMDFNTADSLISLYIGNKLDSVHSSEISVDIDEAGKYWYAEVERLLKGIDPLTTIPRTIYLMGKSHENFLVRTLESNRPGASVNNLGLDMLTVYASAIHSVQ